MYNHVSLASPDGTRWMTSDRSGWGEGQNGWPQMTERESVLAHRSVGLSFLVINDLDAPALDGRHALRAVLEFESGLAWDSVIIGLHEDPVHHVLELVGIAPDDARITVPDVPAMHGRQAWDATLAQVAGRISHRGFVLDGPALRPVLMGMLREWAGLPDSSGYAVDAVMPTALAEQAADLVGNLALDLPTPVMDLAEDGRSLVLTWLQGMERLCLTLFENGSCSWSMLVADREWRGGDAVAGVDLGALMEEELRALFLLRRPEGANWAERAFCPF
jgi:hypothetical protein